MSHGWQQMLAWVAGVVVPLLVLITALITVLELERMRRHHLAHVRRRAASPLQCLSAVYRGIKPCIVASNRPYRYSALYYISARKELACYCDLLRPFSMMPPIKLPTYY